MKPRSVGSYEPDLRQFTIQKKTTAKPLTIKTTNHEAVCNLNTNNEGICESQSE